MEPPSSESYPPAHPGLNSLLVPLAPPFPGSVINVTESDERVPFLSPTLLAMAETSSFPFPTDFPTIDPTSFDLIVLGTGLPESLLAAASAAAGKSVLHLDANPFYGSHFASLPLPSFSSFFNTAQLPPDPSPPRSAPSPSSSYAAIDLRPHRLYSEIEITGSSPEPSKDFLLDLSGPRVLYCADKTVDLMLRSGASHHIEFKSVEASLIYWEGRLCSVPDSRQAIFKDRTLGLAEKREMMKFLKLVQQHIGSGNGEAAAEAEEAAVGISAEDLEIPFAEFLKKQRLPPKIRTIILYAIALANYDQENAESCKKLITTKEGIESLALYNSSVGRDASSDLSEKVITSQPSAALSEVVHILTMLPPPLHRTY